jgi:hypothetical protein
MAQIRAALEKVGRTGVPEGVRGDAPPKAGGFAALPEDAVESLDAKAPARDRGHEDRWLLRRRHEVRPGITKIAATGFEREIPDRNDAVFAALPAADPDGPATVRLAGGPWYRAAPTWRDP